MNLEEFKKKVEKSLIENNNCNGEEKKKLMKIHEKHFKTHYESGLTPEETSIAMVMNLI